MTRSSNLPNPSGQSFQAHQLVFLFLPTLRSRHCSHAPYCGPSSCLAILTLRGSHYSRAPLNDSSPCLGCPTLRAVIVHMHHLVAYYHFSLFQPFEAVPIRTHRLVVLHCILSWVRPYELCTTMCSSLNISDLNASCDEARRTSRACRRDVSTSFLGSINFLAAADSGRQSDLTGGAGDQWYTSQSGIHTNAPHIESCHLCFHVKKWPANYSLLSNCSVSVLWVKGWFFKML